MSEKFIRHTAALMKRCFSRDFLLAFAASDNIPFVRAVNG